MQKAALPQAQTTTPPRCCVAHCWITRDIQRLLEEEANRRHMHPDKLAADLLTIVIGDDLTAALLER